MQAVHAKGIFGPADFPKDTVHLVADLAADGSLRPDTARVFRVDGQPIRFHRHQAQAIAKATQRLSFAVTTGTGSGKSLCFFVPIIDAARLSQSRCR